MVGPVLETEDLCIGIERNRQLSPVVRGVTFSLKQGEIFGLAGGSGAGKTLTACALSGLLARPARMSGGLIRVSGCEIRPESLRLWRGRRGRAVFMIFQDTASALNPVLAAGRQIREVLIEVRGMSRPEAMRETIRLLRAVGLRETHGNAYPFQLSGGMRQRVQIAIALSLSPKVIVADEPTTGLDPVTRTEILTLLRNLRDEQGISLIFISHDLRAVSYLADRMGIMHKGRLVETGTPAEIFDAPQHPCTKALISHLMALEGQNG
ncbi:ABC transporter ATP-binding protein [Desulfonema ishimotonii]|uniref:ABC transporter ATP-binding protein n=1 Tax=Desulfonema ishimotonii TaxID=45657 RepID=A0A401FX52_9BACT|nr:ABC transporter ATP-binding protein [Desulfonema ishimotonii]GBC61568.1 ABC transporter ATP-binding protein [Desulfonema ishimotonii]